MNSGEATEFDEKIHSLRLEAWRDRFAKDWSYEVENGQCFEFVLKNGETLSVREYKLNKLDDEGVDRRVLFAELEGEIVGFLSIKVEPFSKVKLVRKCISNVEVLRKGLGIGGKLEKVKQYLLQVLANQTETVENEMTDDNRYWINTEHEAAIEEYKVTGDKDKFRERIVELLFKRQLWLKIYGPEGGGGYDWSKYWEITKTYKKGGNVPSLDCRISENTLDFGKEYPRL